MSDAAAYLCQTDPAATAADTLVGKLVHMSAPITEDAHDFVIVGDVAGFASCCAAALKAIWHAKDTLDAQRSVQP